MLLTAGWSDRPPPGASVDCPGITGDPSRHTGAAAAYRCARAVTDLYGNVVILRVGRGGPGGFGLREAWEDHHLGASVVERVVRTVHPRSAPGTQVRHVTQLREQGGAGVVDVEVLLERAASPDAPDREPFGLVTAFCRNAGFPGDVVSCPSWLDGGARP